MIELIFAVAALVFDVPRAALAGPSRAQHIVAARQAVMLALRKRTRLSLAEIGRLLGGRDHTTVLYGISAAERRCRTDAGYRQAVAALLDEDDVPAARPADVRLRWALASAGGIVMPPAA